MTKTEMTEQVRRERDRFVAFAFASADILLELDDNGAVLFADGATRGLLGYEPDSMVGQNFHTLIDSEADSTQGMLDALDQAHRMNRAEITLRSCHGDNIPFLMSGFRLPNMADHTYLSLSILADRSCAEHVIKRDLGTGLLKPQAFAEDANEKIIQAQKDGEPLQVTLLDFPELQEFLDALPPEAASQLLLEIGDYIRSNSIDGDTAGMLNDEAYSFVHDASCEPAKMINDIINITKKADPTGKGLEVRTQTIEADPGELSEQDSANALLYTLNQFANHAGEDFTIHSLSQGYADLLDNTVERMAHFKQTVNEEDFKLAFQPIVDLKSGLIHHYEVLVRINNQDVFKNPFDFITFGEQSGMIGDFDLLMCQKVYETLEKTSKKGNYPIVAVNISGKSLDSLLFKDALDKLNAMYQKQRKQMIFEVTESSKIADMVKANEFLQDLRAKGHLCCLDDFGTGESSFEYLRNLQVDFIKIDGSYVRESLKTPRGQHMLKAMAGLCRDLDVTTIGEMVEDEKCAAMLWDLGVKFGQGYLFGKPDVDEETLINCKKPTPFYKGMMRAKRIPTRNSRPYWAANN